MTYRTALIAGISLAGLGVAIGAFGAHGLRSVLQETGRAETFELAVRYQFYHAFALIFCGILKRLNDSAAMTWPVICFIGGIVVFCGSLYALSLTGITTFGAITPLGGTLFIVGWILMLLGVLKRV